MTSYYFGSGCDCPDCMKLKEGAEEVTICGFCERLFRGQEFLSPDETAYFNHLGITPEIGCCPESNIEFQKQEEQNGLPF